MTPRAARRIRWSGVGLAVLLWFVGLAFNFGGNAIHLVLVLGMVLLVYELLVDEAVA